MTERIQSTRTAHPVLFLILLLPLGVTNGYVVVTLAYLLSHAGASVSEVAALVALSLFPQTWKVLFAPIVDTTLSNKMWFLISSIATGALMIATAVVPAKGDKSSPHRIARDAVQRNGQSQRNGG